jgi:flagellar hook-associated protein 1 FlgK
MGISSALSIALTGLRANQLQLDTTANNVANAGTIGYSRKYVSTSQFLVGEVVSGVRTDAIARQLNLQVQRQWRSAVSGAEYAAVRATTMQRLDESYGGPNNPNSLDALYNAFTAKLEALAASPENTTARTDAVNGAAGLANGLRALSNDIQTLRQGAEEGIGTAVDEANELLQRIADLDKQVVRTKNAGESTAGLEDERDLAVDRLAELMDIRVNDQPNGGITIQTTSGTQLYDDIPAKLRFDTRGELTPSSRWSTDPDERGVGTVVIDNGPGKGIDLFADGAFSSGHIAALKELRDETLVQAQAQLDELAARMSIALSTKKVTGTPNAGPPDGFSIDLAGLKEGNVVTLDYVVGGETRRISFVATEGGAPLDGDYTPEAGDTVVPIDITGTDGDIQAAIQAALGADFNATYAGGQLQIVDATAGTIDITGLGARITVDGTQGDPALALFLDSATGEPFTGLVNGEDSRVGLAQRLMINPAIKADPALLVKWQAATEQSDDARPRALLDALSDTGFTFDPVGGVGSRTAPFKGSVSQYLRQVVSSQGAATSAAVSLAEGQGIVAANLEIRYEQSREVNIDEEMAALIELQTAYQANARVLTVAQEMIDSLLSI